MGAWLGRRTEPRVDYRAPVRVIWPGEVSGVVARGVNLSSAGILVDAPTPTPCAVGSDVLCDVTLPRGPRLLRGRVAHRRVLPSAKVGMGIEFVDLSPREVAELRDVVDESQETPERVQRVKVRFEGTTQVVRARAFPTDDGFRLVTSLPFLKPDTEVDIGLAPDASVSVRGWVSVVALERGQADGVPRLLIDVRVDDPDPWGDRSAALTPVVEPAAEMLSEAVPEHVWEPDALGATSEPASFDVPVDVEESVPTLVESWGAAPAVASNDRTEIVELEPRSRRWRAVGGGMIAGTIALCAFIAAIVMMKMVGSGTSPPSGKIATEPPPPVLAAPAAPAVADAPVVAAPPRAPEAAAEEPATFTLGLTGSLAGARRYPLRDPDGVAFNLPQAHALVKLGTYRPDVPGLRSLWVRALPGGGTHLRFYFASGSSAPRVELARGAVRVTAR
jgi:hypothetical protein